MCHVAQENGACANRVSILTGRAKSQFSQICSFLMSDLNGSKFTMEVPSTQGRPNSKFEKNSSSHSRDTSNQTFEKIYFVFFYSSFCTLCKNCYNSCMHVSTHIGGLKAITSIKFGVNLINIQGVISNFKHKTKSNFCHAYRVNHFEQQPENWYAARLSIRGVLFGG